MARTFINQSTQIGNSELYSDTLETGAGLEFTGSVTIQDDLNALRTMVKAVSGEANWYLAPTASLFGLSGSLDSEISRAISAELVLTNDLSTEVSTARSAEASLGSDISTEVSRATSAEASLGSDISTETSRATSAEASLGSDISSEVSRATSAEASLGSDISTETSRASAAEESLELNLSSEVVRATSVEAVLSSSISSEVARATSAETSLDNRIDAVSGSLSFVISNVDPTALDSLTEVVAAFQSADSNLNGAITSLATALSSSISTETSRAQSVETVLSSSISSEVSRATSAEASLGSVISTEVSRATSAEASLGSVISTEVSRATSAEASLATSLSSEISSEVSRAEAAYVNVSGDTMTGALVIDTMDIPGLVVSGTSTLLSLADSTLGEFFTISAVGGLMSMVEPGGDGLTNANMSYSQMIMNAPDASSDVQAGVISLLISGTAALPTADEHVATKKYVDNQISGLDARSEKVFSVVQSEVLAGDDLSLDAGTLDIELPVIDAALMESKYDIFLNGMMLRPGATMDVQKGAGAKALKLNFKAVAGDLLCVVVYA